MSIIGDRLREAMAARGVEQLELANAVGCTQGAISQILVGTTLRSRFLPEIAEYLGVSLQWLRGENVPRDLGASATAYVGAKPQTVTMQVLLPSEAALARMFEGLLLPLDLTRPKDEIAQLLARRLPTGFAQLRDLAPEHAPAVIPARGEAVPPPARDHRESPPSSRT